MEASDYEVIQECIGGNPDRFEVLVTRYKRFIFSIVYKHFNSMDEAEDIAQEVFIKIYKSLHLYNPQYKFSTWSAKITVNLCLDILRKKKVTCTTLDDIEPYISDNQTPELEYLRKEQSAILYDAIDILPEKYRSIFRLYHEDGISYKEIADTLEMPMSIIKNRLFRARVMIKENILAINSSFRTCNL